MATCSYRLGSRFTSKQQYIVQATRPRVQRRCESTSPMQQPNSHTNTTSSVQPPSEEKPLTNPYKPFYRPFGKVFLTAMFTYQVLYWAWEKLRLDEERRKKLEELRTLQGQVEEYKLKRNGRPLLDI